MSDENRYEVGDVLTVQVKVSQVVETEEGLVYRVVPRGEEYALRLDIPAEDVINKVEDYCVD